MTENVTNALLAQMLAVRHPSTSGGLPTPDGPRNVPALAPTVPDWFWKYDNGTIAPIPVPQPTKPPPWPAPQPSEPPPWPAPDSEQPIPYLPRSQPPASPGQQPGDWLRRHFERQRQMHEWDGSPSRPSFSNSRTMADQLFDRWITRAYRNWENDR
jgi:hypothetical protein